MVNLPASDGSDPIGDAQRATMRGVRSRTIFDAAAPGETGEMTQEYSREKPPTSEVQVRQSDGTSLGGLEDHVLISLDQLVNFHTHI